MELSRNSLLYKAMSFYCIPAFDNILKLMSSDDVKLVSKPAAKTKFKVF